YVPRDGALPVGLGKVLLLGAPFGGSVGRKTPQDAETLFLGGGGLRRLGSFRSHGLHLPADLNGPQRWRFQFLGMRLGPAVVGDHGQALLSGLLGHARARGIHVRRLKVTGIAHWGSSAIRRSISEMAR